MHDLINGTPCQCCGQRMPGALSDREREVFALLGEGIGTKQIARRLHRSHKTIESHRESIKQKLNLPDSGQLQRYAVLCRVRGMTAKEIDQELAACHCY